MRKDEIVRAGVLQAAEKLFQKWGIGKTTMEDIAREAGKGKSTLYYYFKSKEEVLEAAAVAQNARILDRIKAEIAAKGTAREKLLTYVYTMFQEFRRAMALFEIATGEIKADKPFVDGLMVKLESEEAKILEPILKTGIERGEFKIIKFRDVKATVRAILAVKRSLTINLFVASDDKDLIDHILRLLSEGL